MSSSGSRDIKFRIGVTGGSEGKRTLDDFAVSGVSAYSKMQAAARAAGETADASEGQVRKIDGAFKSARDSFSILDREFAAFEGRARAAMIAAQSDAQARSAAAQNSKFSQFMGISTGPSDSAKESATAFGSIFAAQDATAEASLHNLQRMADQRNAAFSKFLGIGVSAPGGAKESATAFSDVIAAQDAKAEASLFHLQRLADQKNATFSQFMGIGSGSTGTAKDSASVFEAEAKALGDVEARAAAVRAQINPLAVAQERLNADLANYSELNRRGRLTTDELAAANLQANQRYKQTAQSLGHLGDGGRLAGYQVTNLGYQLNDIFVSLASGQAPMRVFMQQGSQIAQIFSGSGRGVGSILKEIGERALGLVTPFRLAGGGFAAVIGTIVYAYDQWIAKQNQLEQALSGNGRGAGATTEQVNDIATSSSRAARVSISSAREIEEAFAGTGKIGVENFAMLTIATARWAKTTGESVDQAKKDLAGGFGNADLLGGLDQLNGKIGFLDDKTREYIRTLVLQGDRQGAIKAGLDALNGSIDGSAAHTSMLGRSWSGVWNAASDAIDKIGQALAGGRLSDRISNLRADLKHLTAPGVAAPESRIASVKAALAAAEQEFDALQSKATTQRSDELARSASITGGDIARQLEPNAALLRTLQDQQTKLSLAINDPKAAGKLGAGLALAKDRYDAVTRAIASLTDEHGKLRSAEDVNIKKEQLGAQLAALPNDKAHAAKRAQILEQQKSLDLTGKVITATQAETEVKLAGAKAYNEASLHTDKDSAARDRNNKLIDAQTRGEMGLASAYLIGGAAAAVKEARLKALTESAKDGVSVETRTRQVLGDQVAKTAVDGAKMTDQMRAETTVRKDLNSQLADGSVAQDDYESKLQLELQLRPLLIARAIGTAEQYAALTDIIRELSIAQGDLNSAQKRTAMLNAIGAQRDQLTILKATLALVGVSQNRQDIILAQLREAIDLRRQGIDLQSVEAKKRIENVGLIEAENQAIRRQNDAIRGVQDVTSSAIDGVIGVLTGDGSLGGVLKQFGKDTSKQLLTMGLANPLKNSLFGQNNPTTDDVGGLGGFFSTMFGGSGGKPDGSATAPYHVVMADGLGTDKISSILSGSGGGISGLLSGSGSGGGIGGFVQKALPFIASLFHDGLKSGVVGGGGGLQRSVPAAVFAGARRMHEGGIVGDEVPIIAKKGEVVGWPDQMASAYGGGHAVHVHQGPKTIVIQGGAGPAEIEAAMARLEDMDRRFEGRVASTVGQLKRRGGLGA